MRTVIAVFFALIVVPVFSTADDGQIEVLGAGIFTVSQSREVLDASAPSGKRFVDSDPTLLLPISRIPATIGTRFGIAFRFKSAEVVKYRRVWRLPPAGITNPRTGNVIHEHVLDASCRPNSTCFSGYPLREEFELVPGTWTVEIWIANAKVLERSFEVYRP